jgi:bifunctional DNase/RNase
VVKMIEVTVHDVLARIPRGQGEKPDVIELLPGAAAKLEAMPSLHRVVALKAVDRERVLPIWVGSWEGDMIAAQLAGKQTPRPMTFELMARMLAATQATVRRVAVTQLAETTFYATVWLATPAGPEQAIDARPSDAIALALRVKAPILVDEAVMESAGTGPEELPGHLEAGREVARETPPEPDEATWRSLLEMMREG